jgi:hypothetical protein
MLTYVREHENVIHSDIIKTKLKKFVSCNLEVHSVVCFVGN